jgi:hypothetical protein
MEWNMLNTEYAEYQLSDESLTITRYKTDLIISSNATARLSEPPPSNVCLRLGGNDETTNFIQDIFDHSNDRHRRHSALGRYDFRLDCTQKTPNTKSLVL